MNFESPEKFTLPSESLKKIQPSRLNILRSQENTLPEEKLPPEILFGQKIRKTLKNTVENGQKWPEAPQQLESLDDFFNIARQTVTNKWQEKPGPAELSAQELINQQCEEWLKNLPSDAQRKNPQMTEILQNPAKLEERLNLQSLGPLEPLKKLLPEAWSALTVVVSEKQLAKVALARRWAKEVPDETLSQLRLNRQELQLMPELAALAGKLIDHGYLKQEELANTPGGAEPSDLAGRKGGKYVYQPYLDDSKNPTTMSFSKVFPFELKRFKNDLFALADKVNKQLEENLLPKEKYQNLPAFLKQLGKIYGSPAKTPHYLHQQWLKLYENNAALINSGCPLIINPQEDNPNNVTGIEMRLGFKDQESQKLEKDNAQYKQAALEWNQNIFDNHPGVLKKRPQKTSDVFFNNQYFSFGANLQANTDAENYHQQAFINANELKDTALTFELPILEKFFKDIKINKGQYVTAALLEALRHELGHDVASYSDEEVLKRVGETPEAEILEELKAETVGIKLGLANINQLTDEEIDSMLLSKLGTSLSSLKYKSSEPGDDGEPYFLAGAKIMKELLNNGSVVYDGENLKITSRQKCLDTIAQIGEEIINIYQDTATTPEKIENYINRIKTEISGDRPLQRLKIDLSR